MKYLDVVKTVSKNSKVSKSDVEKVLKSLGVVIRSAVSCNVEVSLPSIGKFVPKVRDTRMGTHPKTLTPIVIPSRLSVVFKPAKEFKNCLSEMNPDNAEVKEEE